MDWIQFSIMLVTFVGLFYWNRTESRTDARHTDAKLESTRELVRAIHQEGIEFRIAIQKENAEFRMAMLNESKDFHGRLCAIEERNSRK